MICHALVATFMIGMSGMPIDWQFVDYCIAQPPAACWAKFVEKRGPRDTAVTLHAVCVDENKKVVYRGRIAEMIDT